MKLCGLCPFLAAFLAAVGSGPVSAQSSVSLYGILDTGVTYTNNVASDERSGVATQLQSGVAVPERWGVVGREDLGNDAFVTFRLESGFQTSDGKNLVPGTAFGQQAYVGVGGHWGTMTLGRQYDLVGDVMPAYAIGANTPAGLFAWSLPANAAGGYVLDNRVWGLQVDNAIKYVTPVVGGFSAGAMYGSGNVPGSVAKNSSSSFVMTYDNNAFSASVGYFGQKDVAAGGNVHDIVGGMAYALGALRIFGLASTVWQSADSTPRANTYELGATFQFGPALQVGGGFQYQKRNGGVGSANQVTCTVDYFLSKRTDIYAVATLAHDHGFGAQAEAGLGAKSSTSAQTAMRIGIKHAF